MLSAAVCLFAMAYSASAQVTPQTPVEKKEAQSMQQENRKAIKTEELPDAIKTTISGNEYKGWTVNSAFIVQGANEYYEVVMMRDKETKTVRFDKSGKSII